jgi:hypothetical protein
MPLTERYRQKTISIDLVASCGNCQTTHTLEHWEPASEATRRFYISKSKDNERCLEILRQRGWEVIGQNFLYCPDCCGSRKEARIASLRTEIAVMEDELARMKETLQAEIGEVVPVRD